MQTALLRIGTRGSPLALAQAHEIAGRLGEAHGFDKSVVEIRTFTTKGDSLIDRPLSEFGGKGLFTKEIEDALLQGSIDLAVHSSKDLPTQLPDGLVLTAFPPREDTRDAFLSDRAEQLQDLPRGAILGTSSLRRKALCLMLRPDLRVVEFRGNVATRMRKLGEGVADATLLALAGLKRLGVAERATSLMATDAFLPAIGQGAIAIETRADREEVRAMLEPINHGPTQTALLTERAFLAALDGSCRTPIGGLATIDGDRIHFRGIIVTPDGTRAHRTERTGSVGDAEHLGRDAGEELARIGGPDFFTAA